MRSKLYFTNNKNNHYLCNRKRENNVGAIAQLVEQRTENPCVPGSIPGGTTGKSESYKSVALFFYIFTPCLGGSLNGSVDFSWG